MIINIKDRKNILNFISEIRFNTPSKTELLHDKLVDVLFFVALNQLGEGNKINHINDLIRQVKKHKKEKLSKDHFLKMQEEIYAILNITKG